MPSVVAKGLGRVFFPDDMGKDAIAAAMPRVTGQLEGLAMDTTSRMQRAKDMGFDVDAPVYHGTTTDFDAFEIGGDNFKMFGEGVYFAKDPKYAERFGDVKEFFAGKNLASWGDYNAAKSSIPSGISGQKKEAAAIQEVLRDKGFDGIDAGREIVIFDPSNIRSVSAAFDTSKKESSNLLAGIGALGAGTTAALYTPEQNKALADSLKAKGLSHLIPTGDKITADEFPKLEAIANFLDENTQTVFGPAFEGISTYLRGFGDDADAKKKAKRALGAALDLL